MSRELIHNTIKLPEMKGMVWRPSLSVWSNSQKDGLPNTVDLVINRRSDETVYVDMTPNEARALAALLVMAADTQERREVKQ